MNPLKAPGTFKMYYIAETPTPAGITGWGGGLSLRKHTSPLSLGWGIQADCLQ